MTQPFALTLMHLLTLTLIQFLTLTLINPLTLSNPLILTFW